LDNSRHFTGSRIYAEVFSGCQARTTLPRRLLSGHGCLLTPVTEQRHAAPKCQQQLQPQKLLARWDDATIARLLLHTVYST